MKKLLKFVGIVIIIAVVISAITGKNESKETTNVTKVDKENIEYTDANMNDLIVDLENNSAAAKEKYNGKYLNLTGFVSNIDSDGKYFDLRNDNMYSFIGIQIYLDDSQKDYILNLSKDQQVTVKVKVTDVGEVLGYSANLIE